MKPEVKLVGNMNDLLQHVCVGDCASAAVDAGADGWVLQLAQGEWTIQVTPSRGAAGPPYNMRVLDPSGVERKCSYWIESMGEAVSKAEYTIQMGGGQVDRRQLLLVARSFDVTG